MFTSNQYELIDFGEGRKLERVGGYLLDRPAVGTEAQAIEGDPKLWKEAARFERGAEERGKWRSRFPLPGTWEVTHDRSVFEIKPTEFGHIGLFAEQAANWDWIARQVERAEPPLKLLNLFAYTGGSTLAAAAAGAEVVHLDAAQPTVAWARQNAALSGLDQQPIRWIVEDAERFVGRELKRGNRYDAVILDPPSYGHGPKGEVWKIGDHLPHLLALLAELTGGEPKFLLLTSHSPGYGAGVLLELLRQAFGREMVAGASAGPMTIATSRGRALACGTMVRVPQ